MKVIGEIILFKALRYIPTMVAVLVMIVQIKGINGGVTWYEVSNTYDCEEYWWTVLTFTNDFIPYFV
jgi:hypothetical protein